MLKANELEKQEKFWIKREQKRFRDTEKVNIDVKSLDLQEDGEGIYIHKGRVEGGHPTSQKSSRLQNKSYSLSTRELCTGDLLLQ